MLGFGLVEFSCRFSSFGPTFVKIIWLDIKPKLERKQTSPRSPKQIAQDKQSADEGKKDKTRRTGQNWSTWARGHHGPTVVTTMARGGSHGQTVVAATAMVAVPLPGFLRFFCGPSFSTRLWLDCCLLLPLKMKNESGSKVTHCS